MRRAGWVCVGDGDGDILLKTREAEWDKELSKARTGGDNDKTVKK